MARGDPARNQSFGSQAWPSRNSSHPNPARWTLQKRRSQPSSDGSRVPTAVTLHLRRLVEGCVPSLPVSALQPFELVRNRPRRTTDVSFGQGALEICQIVLDGFQNVAVHRGEYDRYGNLEYRLVGERCEKWRYRFRPFMP